MSESHPPIGAYRLERDDGTSIIWLLEELPTEDDVMARFVGANRHVPDLAGVVAVKLIRQWEDESAFAAWARALPEHALIGWHGISCLIGERDRKPAVPRVGAYGVTLH